MIATPKHLLLAISCTVFLGCGGKSSACKEIFDIAEDTSAIQHMRDWVEANISSREVNDLPLRAGGGMWPGTHIITLPFDWKAVGFPDTGQVRIIGKLSSREDVLYEQYQSVFFGIKSRYGILVRLRESEEFGVDKTTITLVNSDIAVVCGAE